MAHAAMQAGLRRGEFTRCDVDEYYKCMHALVKTWFEKEGASPRVKRAALHLLGAPNFVQLNMEVLVCKIVTQQDLDDFETEQERERAEREAAGGKAQGEGGGQVERG